MGAMCWIYNENGILSPGKKQDVGRYSFVKTLPFSPFLNFLLVFKVISLGIVMVISFPICMGIKYIGSVADILALTKIGLEVFG